MRKMLVSVLTIVFALMLTQSAWAFSDIGEIPHQAKIRDLKEAGVVQGEADGKFNPQGQLTYASGVTMLVKGLDLSLARFLFIKEPQAADYYTNVEDGMWYSEAFVIAQVNGLDIPRDVDPNQNMTREQFAHHLFRAIEATGDYAYILPYILIEDEADVHPDYMSSIQTLLVSQIVSLDKEGRFKPKAEITRAEAAEWLHNAREFVRKMAEMPDPLPEPKESPFHDLALEVEAVNEDVNAVTVTAQAPHPGYGIRIASIRFIGEDAVIYTDTIWPDPDMMYPQVLAKVSAVTYIGTEYKPVLAEEYFSSPVPAEEQGQVAPDAGQTLPAPDPADHEAENGHSAPADKR